MQMQAKKQFHCACITCVAGVNVLALASACMYVLVTLTSVNLP